ncbi:MAG: hypothetical protein LBI64_06755, partial [Coriobacteriales bacterium]|nr:hypothetical protein [Coriobacteriales bacterium]
MAQPTNAINATITSLYERKSCRAFMQQAISAECRAAIIDAAITAPTAGCQSLYTLLDITDQE